MNRNTTENTEKRNKILAGGLLVLVALLAVILAYQFIGLRGAVNSTPDTQSTTAAATTEPAPTPTPDNSNKMGFVADKDNTDGGISGKSKDEIVADLNKKIQEGMINISMNTNPIFENGKAKGTLMITNSPSNHYPQMIEIYTKDDHKLIYSGGVEVGHKIETSTLSVDLPKGTYDCIAYFNAVNPETSTRVGTAAANIKITILA